MVFTLHSNCFLLTFKDAFRPSLAELNSLPYNEVLDLYKLETFADDKRSATKELDFLFDREENIVGKVENAGYQHFLLFPQCFQKPCFPGSLKVGIM